MEKRLHTKFVLLIFALICTSTISFGQSCLSEVIITLTNIKGGVYANQAVELISYNDGKSYKQVSNAKGEATFVVPCKQKYDVKIANYTQKEETFSPETAGTSVFVYFEYEPNMAEKDRLFAMTEKERLAVDIDVRNLPDTTFIDKGIMKRPGTINNYCTFTLTIKNLENKPLVNETVVLTGAKRKLSFKGVTNSGGSILFYLPKGDDYSVNFRFSKNYMSETIKYEKGTSTGFLDLSYMGTVEFLRRKKIEDDRAKEEKIRQEAEEKRRAEALALLYAQKMKDEEEKKRFEEECKKLGLTPQQALLRNQFKNITQDTIVLSVLKRNKWEGKLFICDVSGDMLPYISQLALWYKNNYEKEKYAQFVFFNNGDNKGDTKPIGQRGGIYYQTGKGYDSLIYMMNDVRSKACSWDGSENDIEALLKGVKMAKPYKEIIMLVDKDAKINDMDLLKDFKQPVHVILCISNRPVNPQHLKIAWQTKGSFHTSKEDITNIGNLVEGDTITVEGVKYKIMGGEFVSIH